MKKILNIIINFNLITILVTSISACSPQYLTITVQDQSDKNILKYIAFDFMYKLPKEQQTRLDAGSFGAWFWRTRDDFTLRGTAEGYIRQPNPENKMEYWRIDLRKTLDKGLFVWDWQENDYDPGSF